MEMTGGPLPTNLSVSVIVPILQEAAVLDLFLTGLHDTLPDNIQLILVDDGCRADTKEILSCWKTRFASRLDFILLTHPYPAGDGAAFNEGLKHSTGDIVVRLDSDLAFRSRWLEKLLHSFQQDATLGVMSGILLYPQSGGINHAGLSFYQCVGRHLFLNSRPEILPSTPYSVQAAALTFAAIRRDLLEAAGGFDCSYHSGYDDLDLTLQISAAGAKIMVDPAAVAFHWERSAGPYRDTGRKRNLAVFWHRWGDRIRDDLWSFLAPRLQAILIGGAEDRGVVGVDLSGDRIAAQRFWSELKRFTSIDPEDVRYVSHRCSKEGPIALPLVLGADGHRELRRMLFLTDNFVRLRGNSYFLERRLEVGTDDLIIDFHGNVVRIQELVQAAWPGEKIR